MLDKFMPELSRERILEWQKIFKKEYDVDYTYEETAEAANNLIGLFYTLWKIDQRLKKEKNENKKETKRETV